MYKNATYREKFADLKEWIPYLVDSVKKDLRNDHLKQDLYFVKKFLASKNIHKIPAEELAQAYQKAIEEEVEQGEKIAEFITSRWLLKNAELYEYFEKELSRINPDFATIEEITPKQAQTLIDEASKQFGAPHTYLFSVLNSVVFPKESFQALKVQAKNQKDNQEQEAKQADEKLTVDQMRKEFEREVIRLTDKYEKKLSGLQKKYVTDVENLKKQISSLQRKMHQEKTQ